MSRNYLFLKRLARRDVALRAASRRLKLALLLGAGVGAIVAAAVVLAVAG